MTVVTTLAEFARDPRKHIELVDGEIVVSPNAGRLPHFHAAWKLTHILYTHGLISGMEANLILDDRDPLRPLVREPDVYVLRQRNPGGDGLFQRAENTLLVVEVMSPGSQTTDWVEKMAEYADAGIPHYWIIEFFGDAPHLYTFSLEPGGYGEREHWDREVDVEVAGVRVRFDMAELEDA